MSPGGKTAIKWLGARPARHSRAFSHLSRIAVLRVSVACVLVLGACDGRTRQSPPVRAPSRAADAGARRIRKPARDGDAATALVRAYVARDAGGARLSYDAWSSSVVTWPEEPGWDIVTVARSTAVRPLPAVGDTARVEVVYADAGIVEPLDGMRYQFSAQDSTERQVFKLVRQAGAWKIADPQVEPHISPATAVQRYGSVLEPPSLAALTQLSTQR